MAEAVTAEVAAEARTVAEEAVTAAVVAEARTAVAEAVPTAVGEARTEAVHTDTKFQNLQPAPNFGAGFFCSDICEAVFFSQLFSGIGV